MFENYKYKRIAYYLKLNKPLIIFDLDASGHAISVDRLIRLAYVKIMPNGRYFKKDFLFNPEIKISDESTAVHGISNKDVEKEPLFKEKSKEIESAFQDSCYSGFNILNFDLPLLKREFLRAGIRFEYTPKDIIDAKTIFNFMEPRTLSGAYYHYTHKEYRYSNNAITDVEAVAEIMEKQLKKYKDIQDINFIKEIHSPHDENYYIDHEHKFYWRGGEAYFNFSKYRDLSLAEIVKKDKEFLEWLMKADFSQETKKIVKNALENNTSK